MSKAWLTIVDEDTHTLELVRRILEKDNYRVTTENNAKTALNRLEYQLPDLIISELQFSDVDGFNFLKSLSQHRIYQGIPVMVLSSRREADDKIKARELGAQAYVVKPFQREEFLTRIEQILKKFPQNRHGAPGRRRDLEAIYQKLLAHHLFKIQPRVDKSAAPGYDYLASTGFLHFENNGEAINTFEALAAAGLLERKLVDVVHLCPFCKRHQINFREVCPGCGSLSIWIQMCYIHKECGMTWNPNLQNHQTITCAMCGQSITSAMPDVEIGYAYRCAECGKDFSEIDLNCRCLSCGNEFDIAAAMRQEIFAYQIVQKPAEPAPPVPATGLRPSANRNWLFQALQSGSTAFLELPGLLKKFDLEILRARRHQFSVTLICIDFRKYLQTLNPMPLNLIQSLLQDLVKLIHYSLRKNDTLSLKNEAQLVILLPQTHQNIAKIIGHKILHDLESFNDKIQLEMRLASYPEDGMNSEEIINVLELGLEKLNEEI